jgi:hypothetical protein
LARETAITIVFAVLGAFAAMLALTFSFVALYLWLELKLGTITALGILGGHRRCWRVSSSPLPFCPHRASRVPAPTVRYGRRPIRSKHRPRPSLRPPTRR